jgi:hypothetical protein
LQRGGLEQPRIRRNRVALFEKDDVAGDEIGCRDALPLAVSNDVGLRCRHLAERGQRLLCPGLLDVTHQRVEQHDGEDRDRLVGQRGVALIQPQDGGDQRRDEQEHDQHIGELGEELPPRGDRLLRRELVPAMAFDPLVRLPLAQAGARIRLEGGKDVVDALQIRR